MNCLYIIHFYIYIYVYILLLDYQCLIYWIILHKLLLFEILKFLEQLWWTIPRFATSVCLWNFWTLKKKNLLSFLSFAQLLLFFVSISPWHPSDLVFPPSTSPSGYLSQRWICSLVELTTVGPRLEMKLWGSWLEIPKSRTVSYCWLKTSQTSTVWMVLKPL